MKTNTGNYFEDFEVGQTLIHATPRTVTSGDVALYQALYGGRFALQSSDAFAQAMGYARAPVDNLLAFHIVFGKSVPDVSLNAVANLGYAECRFLKPVFVGDTLTAISEVIGLKQNSNGKTGVVYVRTEGRNQVGDIVLTFARWVMVAKRDAGAPAPNAIVPELDSRVDPSNLTPPVWAEASLDAELSGSKFVFDDYEVGERIDHVDGITIEEAEHQMATRLYQNTAKVHFNQHAANSGRFKRRLIYGGVIISIARALSFNGLGNVLEIGAINGGQHAAPAFAGDTIYAWSEVLDKSRISDGVGALRLRLVATKDLPATEYPYKSEDGKVSDGVILDLDYWGLIPA
ncbi:MAG: MaoC family dehydratase [Pseudomonadota bacterium]